MVRYWWILGNKLDLCIDDYRPPDNKSKPNSKTTMRRSLECEQKRSVNFDASIPRCVYPVNTRDHHVYKILLYKETAIVHRASELALDSR